MWSKRSGYLALSLWLAACAEPSRAPELADAGSASDAGVDGGLTGCAALKQEVSDLLGQPQTCTHSSDCEVVSTDCGLPGVCGAFANQSTSQQLNPLENDWRAQQCFKGQPCPDCAGPSAVECVQGLCQAATLSAGGACKDATDCPVPFDSQYKPVCLSNGGFTNGYCALPCAHGFGCPVPDARCRSISATGSATFCFHSCVSDSDCRSSEGYHCCPDWNGFGEHGSACYPGNCPAAP